MWVNPAHYLATSEYSIIGNMGYVEEFVFAESQQGADDYLAAKDTYNHSHPDIGVYAKTNTRVPIRPGNGEVVTIDLDLWNLGQAACSNSVIDVFGGPTNLSENSFHDRFILSQKRSDAINPMEKQNVKLSFTYWTGLEKVFIRVRTKEKDFNPGNNIHVLTFANPNGGPAYQENTNDNDGVLRVAVFDQPGELSEKVDIRLYQVGSQQPFRESGKNPQVWVVPAGKYDVHIKSSRQSSIEQWIRGVNVWPLGEYGGSFNNTVSLDILTQEIGVTMQSLGAREEGNAIRFDFNSSILFYPNEFEVNTFAADHLRKVKTLMSAYPDRKLTIEGHTDNVGDENDNLQLSIKRAEAVKDWLTQVEGILPERLTTRGYGETHPVADNETPAGRAMNRRVGFILSNQ